MSSDHEACRKVQTLKAWVLANVHGELERQEVPVPTPGPGEILVRVRAAGLCHSDVGTIEGVLPIFTDFPIILGHEVAGEIAELGEGVTGFETGQRVAAAGDVHNCPGISRDGAYSEYVIFDAARTVALAENLSWDQAAAATDAGVTAYVGVGVAGGAKAGDRVGIVGLGGLGMVAARMAVLMGAEVFAVEPKEESWEAARELGVSEVVADVSEYAGKDLDLVVDYAGFGTTTSGAVAAVRPGGRVVVVGMGKPEFTVNSVDLVLRSIQIMGATPAGDPQVLREVFALMVEKGLRIPASEIGFEEIPEGLKRLAAGQVSGRLVAML